MKQLSITLLCLILTTTVFAQDLFDTIKNPILSDEEILEAKLIREMDETLNQWYIQHQIGNNPNVKDLPEEDQAPLFNDSIIIKRMKELPTVIPLAFNTTVKRWIELYVCKRKRSSSIMLGLSQYYYPFMREIFDKYNVPEELIYLTIIESGLNPIAVSHAGATGIWQFMYATGKTYGLEENTFVDDRRDPFKATDAAARHLKDLYNIFNDWGLAIAAYNSGPGNVRKAIKRSGNQNDFWSIKNYLPKETQNYFPAYIAALYLASYHNEHGIPIAELTIPYAVDTVMVKKEVHFDQIASVLNIDLNEIKTLNPQYKKMVIPAYKTAYPLRLRANDIIRFIELEDSIYTFKRDSFFMPVRIYEAQFTGKPLPAENTQKIYHTVKSGESINSIAKKYGLSTSELKKMNRLKSNYLKVRQRLLVGYKYVANKQTPIDPSTNINVKDSISNANVQADSLINTQKDTIALEQRTPTHKYHIVKKGDNLSSIASKYHTTIKKLAEFNKIKNINSLKIGQRIMIP